ncbi:hypothetical protein LEP1GSC137_0269 [Leptospira borgpetersenii str. Noumea 25]|nr:hypothetical protein LEP1GSC137_0269 [Leptospira borgpetersenii str. Noumea 25]
MSFPDPLYQFSLRPRISKIRLREFVLLHQNLKFRFFSFHKFPFFILFDPISLIRIKQIFNKTP